MSESKPYRCVNCWEWLNAMQCWVFPAFPEAAQPLCVACYDSLCEQKRASEAAAATEFARLTPRNVVFKINRLAPMIVLPRCCECTSPATHGGYCVYCANRTGNHSDLCLDEAHINEAMIAHHEPRNAAARARNLAALEAEKQKPTQDEVEHPWLCEDDP